MAPSDNQGFRVRLPSVKVVVCQRISDMVGGMVGGGTMEGSGCSSGDQGKNARGMREMMVASRSEKTYILLLNSGIISLKGV